MDQSLVVTAEPGSLSLSGSCRYQNLTKSIKRWHQTGSRMESSGDEEAGYSSPLENIESYFCEILSEKEIKQRQGKIIECQGIYNDTKRTILANLETWEEAKSTVSSQQTDTSKRKFSGDPDTRASSSRVVKSRKNDIHWVAEFPWLRVAGQEQYCEWCSLGTGKMVIVNAANKKTLLNQHKKS